jgi:CRP/FNR family transcriptional regulator, anaerobic regulatory protein
MKEFNCENCNHKLCAKKVPIFSFLSEVDLKKIVDMTGHKFYKRGDVLCREGDRSDTLFIINEGQVKISKLTKDGKEQIIHIYTNGDFFGELSLFSTNEIYNFDVYAITDVKLCTLTKHDMEKILIINPEISLKLLQVITSRLTQTENLAQNLATNDAEIRIASMLIEFAEKYGIQTDLGLMINLPINREEMANYAGVTRETISRKLRNFEELGLISLKGSKMLMINQLNLLKSYVE